MANLVPTRMIQEEPPPNPEPKRPPPIIGRQRGPDGQYLEPPFLSDVDLRRWQNKQRQIANTSKGQVRYKTADQKRRELLLAKSQQDFSVAVITALPENVTTLQRLASGIWVEEETAEGKRVVYQKPPDRQALMFLLEHGIGKATAREKKAADPVIILKHNVPRKPADLKAREAEESEPEEEEDDPFGMNDDEEDDGEDEGE